MVNKTNKKILVTGAFNVLHPGHLRLLRFARECGSELIVAVQSDRLAGEGAHVLEAFRLEGVQSLAWVKQAFIFDEPVAHLVARIRPDIVVKGKEFEGQFNPELLALEEYGAKLVFSSGETFFSSLDLIRKEFQSQNMGTIMLPKDYLTRHRISSTTLQDRVKQFSTLKVCVVGDLIVDEYISCEPLGMSQEDPTIVVTPIDTASFVGGAGIVAAHAAGLGANVKFISVAGDDSTRDFALATLLEAGVDVQLMIDENRPTTLKQRFRTKGKNLLRVSRLHQGAITAALQDQIFSALERHIADADLLVFSDFNYGCLPQVLVDRLIQLGKVHGVLIAADSQSSSQIGDIARFKDVDLMTPTEREARISTRNQEDGLVILAEQLRHQSSARNVLLKLGEEGLLIHAHDVSHRWATDRVPALNSAAKDVAGAGDSLLIASAMTLACGGTIWEAACLGSLAAAIQVSRVGNIPLTTEELSRELT
jgi:rfaE bifunctional protein kinase chain/domain